MNPPRKKGESIKGMERPGEREKEREREGGRERQRERQRERGEGERKERDKRTGAHTHTKNTTDAEIPPGPKTFKNLRFWYKNI